MTAQLASWRASLAASLVALLTLGCDSSVGVKEQEPTTATAWAERAEIFAERNAVDDAINAYTNAISLTPNDANLWTERGILKERVNNDTAADDYSEAIRLDAIDTRALNNRAAIAARAGRFEDAIKDLSAAIERNPNDLLAYQNRILAYLDTGDLDQAEADVDRAEAIDPRSSILAFRRAQIATARGDIDAAVSHYDDALAIAERMGASDDELEEIAAARDALVRSNEPTSRSTNEASPSGIQDLITAAGLIHAIDTPPSGFQAMARPSSESDAVPIMITSTNDAGRFVLTRQQLNLLEQQPQALVVVHSTITEETTATPFQLLRDAPAVPAAFSFEMPTE